MSRRGGKQYYTYKMEVQRWGSCHWYGIEISTAADPNQLSAEWSLKKMKKCLINTIPPRQNLTQLKYCHSCDTPGNCIKAWHRHKEDVVLSCLLCSSRSILSIWACASLNVLNLKKLCGVSVHSCPLFQDKSRICSVLPLSDTRSLVMHTRLSLQLSKILPWKQFCGKCNIRGCIESWPTRAPKPIVNPLPLPPLLLHYLNSI